MAMFAQVDGDQAEELVSLSLGSLGGVITVWEQVDDGWELAWKVEVQGTMRPLLLAANLIGDEGREIVVAADDDVLIISPPQVSLPAPLRHHLTGTLERIDWGGPVGPLVVISGDHRDDVVGFMVSEDVIRLQQLSGVHVLPLDLELDVAPLDLVTVHANDDQYLDLAVAGLGVVDADTDEPKLSISAGVLYGDSRGRYGGVMSAIEGWPSGGFIFPYGGLVAGDFSDDGLADLVLMRVGGENSTAGSLVYLFGEEDGSFLPTSSYLDVGQRLLTIDVNSDGVLDIVYAGLGAPSWLYIVP